MSFSNGPSPRRGLGSRRGLLTAAGAAAEGVAP